MEQPMNLRKAFIAATCSLYAITNKRVSENVKSRTMIPEGTNLWWLLCLSLFCTAGLYLLQIIVLKQLSAFTVNLTYNLEPCYTILIAFGEARELNAAFYVGIGMVILSVGLQTIRTMKNKR